MSLVLKKIQTTAYLTIFFSCLSLWACSPQSGAEAEDELSHAQYVFTYAENQNEGYPTTEGARYFAELVKKRSDGRILINVEGNARLGDEESVVRQLSYGGIDFARLSIATLSRQIPELETLMLPFLYRDADHMWRVLDGEIGDSFMETLSGTGLFPLSWYDAGARNFYNSVRPVRRPEDMKGMRIRVQNSEIMEDLVRALGAEPVEAVYSEVQEMLQLHEADGAENNLPSYMSEGHYLEARYYTVDEHSRVPELQLISEATWELLDDSDQALIAECAEESAVYERERWAEYEEYARKQAEQEGCELIWLTPEERADFKAHTDAAFSRYYDQAKEWIVQIQAVE
ncbi:MAG: TRAP transporter substrate-binding protein [Eubacteriales bacterium]|nr:TRAP transporter substrate-binding protein [Eubacteriales bacterium]